MSDGRDDDTSNDRNGTFSTTLKERHAMSDKDKLIIKGPSCDGHFFIIDRANNIWDGKRWRGFGCPKWFYAFRDAWIETDKAAKSHGKTYAGGSGGAGVDGGGTAAGGG